MPFLKAFQILSNWWLTYWSHNGGEGGTSTQLHFLALYGIINVSAIIVSFIRAVLSHVVWTSRVTKGECLFSEVFLDRLFSVQLIMHSLIDHQDVFQNVGSNASRANVVL